MRIEQTFTIARPPEAVFDYVADPATLGEWQIAKTRVEPLAEGAPREGFRLREHTTSRRGREFEQTVEYAEFERPVRLGVRVLEGPFPVHVTWGFEPHDGGTRVRFAAEGEIEGVVRPLQPLTKMMLAREFARQHDRLRRNVEAL